MWLGVYGLRLWGCMDAGGGVKGLIQIGKGASCFSVLSAWFRRVWGLLVSWGMGSVRYDSRGF